MQTEDGGNNTESEPRARYVARLLDAVEAVEHRVALTYRYARSVVGDHELRACARSAWTGSTASVRDRNLIDFSSASG